MSKSKKEVSLSAYLALELRYEKLKGSTKELRAECRKLRKDVKRIDASRNAWKRKAHERGASFRSLQRQFLLSQQSYQPKGHSYPTWLITLVVILRIHCHCSYGSIKKVITVLQSDYLKSSSSSRSERIPCEQTLQNWVSKVGYYNIKNSDTKRFGKEVALIIDESVRVGSQKLFLALLIPFNKGFEKKSSQDLSFEDVQVFYLQGSESWTGDKIEKALKKELDKQGLILKYVVSDEGNNLKRAIKLLEVAHIPDISHVVATCLKKTFKELEAYKNFSSSVNLSKTRLGLCEHSFLRPPKQRAKSRFLNQEKIVNWAQTIIERWNKISTIAQEKLLPIKEHKKIIKELKICIEISKSISKSLKNNGLNISSIQFSIKYLNQQKIDNANIGSIQKFITLLLDYLKRYENILKQNKWEDKNVYICSDVIERLFGCYKAKLSDNFFITTSTIALEIPLMCLSRKQIEQNVQVALESIKMTNLTEWRNKQSTHNQTTMRALFFKK